jgi:hypothetical protein
MRSGLAVALGLALSALLAVAAVAAQLALLQPPPAAESAVRGSVSVGGVIRVYVNGELRYGGPMSSFTENIVSILHAFLTGSQTAAVVDINGSARVVNMTVALGSEAAERFYLPLTRCIIDNTYHGYPGAVLWLRGPGLNVNITARPPARLQGGSPVYPTWPTDIGITPVIKASYGLACSYERGYDRLMRNATHEWFTVYTQAFQVLQSTPGPVKLTYARLMHDKDGRPIYVPMVEETVPLTLNAGDWVEVYITVYVAGQPNGGGSRFFTLFVYEMLNPDPDQVAEYLDQLMSSGGYLPYMPSLHDTYCGAPWTFLAVVSGYEPEITVTTAPWPYDRGSAAYAYPFYYYYASAPIHRAQLQVERSGKTITLRAVFTSVGGMNVTGSAVLLYHATMTCTGGKPVLTGAEPVPWFSVREDVSVPPGSALLAEVVITFK